MIYHRNHKTGKVAVCPEKYGLKVKHGLMVCLNKAKITIKEFGITRQLFYGKPESEHLINPATAGISRFLKDQVAVKKKTMPILVVHCC
jgi:hypothetical protein